MITSSISSKGKSTVAINLVATLSDSDNNVLLINCDLGGPVIQKFLKIYYDSSGMSTALAEIEKFDQCIIYLDDMRFDVVPLEPVPTNCS